MNSQQARGRSGFRLKHWAICCSGWVLAILLGCYVLPHAYRRWSVRIPTLQQAQWRAAMRDKAAQIASVRWADPRPLTVFAGDSHVEMGPWYDLFKGTMAVRNIGLSQAAIEDVTQLLAALPDQPVETLVLMCGVNNLGRGDTVPACVEKYASLLQQTHSRLVPRRIFVLSVMPLRHSLANAPTQAINEKVTALNEQLRHLCQRSNATFLPVNSAVVNASGTLDDKLTSDGLHLNPAGYASLAAAVYTGLHEKP